jgi:hypothetical protein
VQAQGTQWTITDVQFTRDGRNFIYSSINPTLHLCNVSAGAEQHVAMRLGDDFGIWSMRISEDGKRLLIFSVAFAALEWKTFCNNFFSGTRVVAGTNRAGMVLYDMQREALIADCSGEHVSQFYALKPEIPNEILVQAFTQMT